jgi:hypothetical protein
MLISSIYKALFAENNVQKYGVSSLAAKAITLSLGATALSLGINVVQLDNNVVYAGVGLNYVTPATNPDTGANAFATASVGTATVPADTAKVVGNGDAFVYATEIFGGNSATKAFPSDDYAMIYYQFGADDIALNFEAKFSLSNAAAFAVEPIAQLCLASTCTNLTAKSVGVNKDSVTYGLKVTEDTTSGAANGPFDFIPTNTNTLVLLYKISNAQVLASAGKEIEMTAKMATPSSLTVGGGVSVNPSSTKPIARSADGVKVEILAEPFSVARVSVSSGYLEFTGENTTATTASIGSLQITTPALYDSGEPVEPDGYSPWVFQTTGGVAVEDDKTIFSITGGQFAASKESPGAVELANTISSVSADEVPDDNTAIFKLSESDLSTLANGGFFNIDIVADGKTAINTDIENPPVGTLSITYTTDYYQTIEYPAVELTKIKPDGTTCTLYNIPAPGATDISSVRITNDSSVSGIIYATLYDMEGTEVFSKEALNSGNALEAGKTLVVFTEDLAKLGTWTGRGVLVVSTTLPNIEVLGLLRADNVDNAPLSNLSAGAHGRGCIY